jgi:hypothetical protein
VRRAAVLVAAGVLAGCSLMPTFLRPVDDPLGRADAIAAYDAWLAKHRDAPDARRVQSRRDTLTILLETQAEAGRLRRQLGDRDAEVVKLRQEAERLRADVERLRTDAERLRTDLENLKRIDLRPDRVR